MDRFFLHAEDWGETLILRGDEAHHCSRVMRKQVGDEVVVFDGEGGEAAGRIASLSKSAVEIDAGPVSKSKRWRPEIEIAVGIPKGKSFDLILQKAVEMGVTRIQPLVSAQGNVRFNGREGAAKKEKWDRVVLEACKQCGQNVLPEVALPQDLGDYLAAREESEARFVGALLPGAKPFRESLAEAGEVDRVVLLIGPEGDFSEEEYRRVLEAGFAPVSLGDLVLRTETAVFWMVAAVRYQFQD